MRGKSVFLFGAVVCLLALVVSHVRTLDERNLSRRWWPKQSTFCLFTMQGASMSYHLDLWATAVLYVVLWGVKLFVVAPPTKHNLGLLRSWQESGGDGRREDECDADDDDVR